MDGTLEKAGPQWRLRFTRHLDHPPDKVWRAITEPEHVAAWFPQRIVGTWSVGAPLTFASDYGNFEGEVLAFDPPKALEFRWGSDTIRLEVSPDEHGSVLTLLDTFAEQGKAARDATGWHVCLAALEDHLNGRTSQVSGGEGWQTAHARYVRSFGPQASTIGPPDMAAKR